LSSDPRVRRFGDTTHVPRYWTGPMIRPPTLSLVCQIDASPAVRPSPGFRPSPGLRPTTALTALLCGLVILGGCRLEDRGDDDEAGSLPPVEVRGPEADPLRPDRALGEDMAPPPVLLLGEAFWHGDDTRAVEITGRFVSPEARRALLDPDAPVGQIGGEAWRLGQILVSVDFRGGPARARWQVSGPREVVASYLSGLRDHPADRSPVVEMGVLEMEPRHCCPDGEPEEGAIGG